MVSKRNKGFAVKCIILGIHDIKRNEDVFLGKRSGTKKMNAIDSTVFGKSVS